MEMILQQSRSHHMLRQIQLKHGNINSFYVSYGPRTAPVVNGTSLGLAIVIL